MTGRIAMTAMLVLLLPSYLSAQGFREMASSAFGPSERTLTVLYGPPMNPVTYSAEALDLQGAIKSPALCRRSRTKFVVLAGVIVGAVGYVVTSSPISFLGEKEEPLLSTIKGRLAFAGAVGAGGAGVAAVYCWLRA